MMQAISKKWLGYIPYDDFEAENEEINSSLRS